jgi:hypothetical protein
VQVIAYFNYINRIAHALGVESETFLDPWGWFIFEKSDLTGFSLRKL